MVALTADMTLGMLRMPWLPEKWRHHSQVHAHQARECAHRRQRDCDDGQNLQGRRALGVSARQATSPFSRLQIADAGERPPGRGPHSAGCTPYGPPLQSTSKVLAPDARHSCSRRTRSKATSSFRLWSRSMATRAWVASTLSFMTDSLLSRKSTCRQVPLFLDRPCPSAAVDGQWNQAPICAGTPLLSLTAVLF